MKSSNLTFCITVLLMFFLSGCTQKKSSEAEEAFLGDWYTIKGDVEIYSFLKDSSSYIFVGTQGDRPVVYGTWKIDKEKFVIIMDNGTTTAYSFILKNDTLSFNNGEEIYTLTTPLDVKYPEVRILVNIALDFSDLKFSAPKPGDINWGLVVDSTKSINEFSLKGYIISAGATLAENPVKDISEYLKDSGFEPDTVFFTEICDAYWNNNQIVTLGTSQNPEVTNDSIYIIISSGLIVK